MAWYGFIEVLDGPVKLAQIGVGGAPVDVDSCICWIEADGFIVLLNG